ncbi:hypothetical protein KAR91_33630, partial [Candidatus Pacearchaeota archaeon]|nr:hypothetical protein [Candidatus Pacearchaeota archaeon]
KLLLGVETVNIYFCTALANSVLSKGNGDSNKLKRLAIEYLGYVNDYGIIRDDAPLDEEPLALVSEYNCEDTENTMLLYRLFKPRLKEEDLHDYFTNLMMKGCEGLADAEMNGITIDQKYGAKLSDKYVTKAAELEKDLRAYPEVMEMAEEAGEPFNLESPKQLSVLLFDKFKLPVFKETKTGRSTNVDTMKSLEDKHPFIPTLQLYKKSQKLVSTYLVNLTDTHLKDDGKIHCNFNQDVARTGRLSSSQPNMQNQPSKGEIGKDLKKIFVSSFEGGSLIQADYSQIELRVAAIITNEKGMLDIYANDGDIHRSMAAFITGKSETDVTDEERGNAKPVNFGFLYGQSPKGFVVSAKRDYGVDFTLAEATRIRERYFKMYTALEGWYEHTWAYARKTSYVKTLFGRKRTIFNLHSTNNFLKHKAENQAINCVDDKTEILTKGGWKTVYELVPHEEIYTKNIETGELELHPMKELKRYDDYEGPMMRADSRSFSALTTLNHRWIVDYRTGSAKDRKVKTKFIESSDLLGTNEYKIHLTADGYKGCVTKKWTDDEVALIGWVLTDGFYIKQRCPKTKKEWGNKRVGVVQSLRANPTKVDMIDKMFDNLGVKYTRDLSSKRTTQIRWVTGAALGGKLRKALPEKQLTATFLNELTFEQLKLLYQTMLLGDGCYDKDTKQYRRFCAGNKQVNADMFSMLCSMIGIPHKIFVRDMSKYNPKSTKLLNVPKMGDCWMVELKKRSKAQSGWGMSVIPNWKGLVWCPFVENSNFVARRNGIVYITGNTPVQGSAGEMCILAIYHINKYLKGKGMRSMIVNTVHDSIILDCPKDEVMQTAKIVKTIMENVPTPFDKPIPMKADIEIGPSWGALKEVTM